MCDLLSYAYWQNLPLRKYLDEKNLFLSKFKSAVFARHILQYCSESCFAFETFLQHLFVKRSQQFTMTSPCLDIFPRKSQRKTESLKSLRENLRIFLCDLSVWEIWYEENPRPLNKTKTGTIHRDDKLVRSMTQCVPTTCLACQNAIMDIRGFFTDSKKKKRKRERQ